MTEHHSPRSQSIPEPHRRGDRVQKGSTLSVAEMKARQTAKLRQLADVLIAAGFRTLGEQAKVLGLSRSTTWTILNANHKGSGLSAGIANRILAAPRLPQPVRSILVEYARERAAGLYGGSMAQGRRFAARLSINAVRSEPGTSRDDGGPHVTPPSSNSGNAKHHMNLNDNLRRPDGGAVHLRKKNWEEKSLRKAKEVECWSGIGPPRRGRLKSRLA
jgi:hypothetical protein